MELFEESTNWLIALFTAIGAGLMRFTQWLFSMRTNKADAITKEMANLQKSQELLEASYVKVLDMQKQTIEQMNSDRMNIQKSLDTLEVKYEELRIEHQECTNTTNRLLQEINDLKKSH